MAFEQLPSLDGDEFFKIIHDNPQKVGIVDVGDFLESSDVKNGYYFYVTFRLESTGQEKKISYNFTINRDGKVVVGEGAKLYPLLSYISRIKHGDIRCTKEDIAQGLSEDISFKAISSRQKGKKTWWKIIPINERGE